MQPVVQEQEDTLEEVGHIALLLLKMDWQAEDLINIVLGMIMKIIGHWGDGGGYYEGPDELDIAGNTLKIKTLGGLGGTSWVLYHRAGNGGIAGKGGVITVSQYAEIYAFNGNKSNEVSSTTNETNQAAVYLQAGVAISHYNVTALRYDGDSGKPFNEPTLVECDIGEVNSTITGYNNKYFESLSSSEKIKTFNSVLNSIDLSKQGIGSGAGYIEKTNGTYTVDPSMN